MKQRAHGLAATPVLWALVGCATGSNAPADAIGGTDAGSSNGQDSASSSDSASGSDSAIDALESDDAGGDDASPDVDAAIVDSGSGSDADAESADAAPTVLFGASCLAGTTYTEPFTSDPIADGTFLPLIGSSTYDAANHTLSLAAGSANTQLWIGPRPSWTSYTVSARVRIDTTNGNGGFTFRMESTPASPANNAGQMYYAGIATNQVLFGIENGNWTELSGPSATFVVGTFYTLAVTASGTSFNVSVDGTTYITSTTDATYTFGSIGLRSYASGMTYGAITVTCH